MLPINELFETIQGEAYWTGAPSLFIRLQGCDVGCPWCDTKYTWRINPLREISFNAMLARQGEAQSYALIAEPELVNYILTQTASRHVVLTGGEPCTYDLAPLTKALLHAGRSVQIETSGTAAIRADEKCWVTLSPKINMPGGYSVHPEIILRANELKFPLGKRKDIDLFDRLIENYDLTGKLIWLQPLSQSASATEIAIDIARARGWRVSFQLHKFLGIR